MKKENLVLTCMSVIGGILFAIGMVMALLPEWNMFAAGVVMGGIGAVVLVLIYPIYRRVGGYPKIELRPALVISVLIGVIAALLLGVGMCLVMVPASPTSAQIISGICIGTLGLVGAILNPIINLSIRSEK